MRVVARHLTMHVAQASGSLIVSISEALHNTWAMSSSQSTYWRRAILNVLPNRANSSYEFIAIIGLCKVE
jgi:hypothetical protein